MSRESTVRTGAEMAELAELDRGLAEMPVELPVELPVERARREGLQLTGEGGLRNPQQGRVNVTGRTRDWKDAVNTLAESYGDRVTQQ